MRLHKLKWLTLLSLCSIATMVSALPEDKNQIANLKADFADLQQSSHHGEFKGHVRIVQGSTTLTADRAIVDGDKNNKLQSAKAFGTSAQQAHYVTQTAINKPILNAYANEIHYFPFVHRIDLIGNATIVQGKNILSANKISYDTLQQRVISQSGGKKRVTIVIQPEK